MTKTTTLWCEAGQHEWTRPVQRGPKPITCPDHTEIKVVTTGNKGLDKARAARQKKKNAEEKIWADRVQAILDHPKMNERLFDRYSTDARSSTKSKLIYIQEQLTKNRKNREPSDIANLEKMREKILQDPFNRSGHLL